jgi:hypothetical protein
MQEEKRKRLVYLFCGIFLCLLPAIFVIYNFLSPPLYIFSPTSASRMTVHALNIHSRLSFTGARVLSSVNSRPGTTKRGSLAEDMERTGRGRESAASWSQRFLLLFPLQVPEAKHQATTATIMMTTIRTRECVNKLLTA